MRSGRERGQTTLHGWRTVNPSDTVMRWVPLRRSGRAVLQSVRPAGILCGGLLGLALCLAGLPAAEQGSPYWHNASLPAYPDLGELKALVAISTIRNDDDTFSGPVTTWEDQNQDFQDHDERLRAASYGQAWYSWEIHPRPGEEPLIVPEPETEGGQSQLWEIHSDAFNLLRDRGVETIQFRHLYSRSPGKQGQATVPGGAGAGHAGGGAQWHELIHNLGFGHGSDRATPITSAGGGSFSAPMRAAKQWIREGEGFTQVSVSGVYRLYDVEGFIEVPDQNVGLVIRRMPHSDMDLWLEFRPSHREEFANGVRLIDYGNWGINEPSAGRTIDAWPEVDGAWNHALQVGDSWSDSDRRVKGNDLLSSGATIEALQVNDTTPRSIDVRITFDKRPNQPPEVTLRSSYTPTTAVPVGTPLVLTAEGSDEEGDITKVEWSVNGLVFPAAGEPPFTLEPATDAPFTAPTRVTARMYDEDGVMSESAIMEIYVVEPDEPLDGRIIRMDPVAGHRWIDEMGTPLPVVDGTPTLGPVDPSVDQILSLEDVLSVLAGDG